MNREHLVKDIVDRLVRLPSPFDSHYGVVPLPPSEEYVVLGEIAQAHQEALNSMKPEGIIWFRKRACNSAG